MTNYKTISSENNAELIIKKSKFIAVAKNVENIAQIDELLNEVKKQHLQATHICYGFELITGEQKAFDDNEPSGTAGNQILNVIKKQNLKNIIIIVIRYFGGIKLGAGGLTRAYGKVAGASLKEAQIVNYVKKNLYKFTLSYDESKLLNKLENLQFIELINKDFSEQVTVILQIEEQNYLKLQEFLNDLLNKEVILQKIKN